MISQSYNPDRSQQPAMMHVKIEGSRRIMSGGLASQAQALHTTSRVCDTQVGQRYILLEYTCHCPETRYLESSG